MQFRDLLEGISKDTPEKILKFASIYSKEKAAKDSFKHLVKPQNFTLVKDNETNKFLVITNKETGVLTKNDNKRFIKVNYHG